MEMIGLKGIAWPLGVHLPRTEASLRRPCRNSNTSLDLPIPASPSIVTIRKCPCRASSQFCFRTPSS